MANNRNHSGLICLIIVLGALLHNTGGIHLEVQLEGDDVILKPQFSGVPSEITWRKENEKVVLMKLIPKEEPKYYLLEGRATINRTNGDLTIKNLTREDTGDYEAEVFVNSISQYTKMYLTVRGSRTENKTGGGYITLEPQYIGDPSEIVWTVNGILLVEMRLKPREDPLFYHLQDRATISDTDGILTIRKLIVEDSGLYKAEVTVNDVIQETGIKVTVSEYSCSYRAITYAGIILLTIAVIFIFAVPVFYVFYKKYSCPYGGIVPLVIIVFLALFAIILIIAFAQWMCSNEEPSGPSGVNIWHIGILVVNLIIMIFVIVWRFYSKNKRSQKVPMTAQHSVRELLPK